MLKNLTKLQKIRETNMRHKIRGKLAAQVRKMNSHKDFSVAEDEEFLWYTPQKFAR